MDKWYRIQGKQIIIMIYAKPNAKKTAVIGIKDHELQIALHAKPHQGEANKELIAFFSKLLRLPKNTVILLRGETSRHKQIMVPINQMVQKLITDLIQFNSSDKIFR